MAAMSPALKGVNKFLVQAKKMDKVKPVIAYYLRLHALTQALKIDPRTEEIMEFAGNLMGQLEADKTDETSNKEAAKAQVESFSLMVFKHADDEDRAGNASKKTLQAFHSSYILMELLEHFGDVSDEIKEREKYARWKAADLAKAFREGRTPVPGPPGGLGGDGDGEAADSPMGGAGGGNDMPSSMNAGGDSGGMTPLSEAPPASSSSSPMDTSMGMTPTSSPPGGMDMNMGGGMGMGGGMDLGGGMSLGGGMGGSPHVGGSPFPPLAPTSHQQPPQQQYQQPPQQQFQQPPQPAPASQNPNWQQPNLMPVSMPSANGSGGGSSSSSSSNSYREMERSVVVLTQCEKLAKNALSSMRFADPDVTVEKLEEIVGMLRPISKRYR